MYEPSALIPNSHGSAWIAPNGDYYLVNGAEHYKIASKLDSTCLELEQAGWIHLSYGSIYFYRDMTQRQLDILFDLLIKAQERSYSWFGESWSAFQRILDRNGKCPTRLYGEY